MYYLPPFTTTRKQSVDYLPFTARYLFRGKLLNFRWGSPSIAILDSQNLWLRVGSFNSHSIHDIFTKLMVVSGSLNRWDRWHIIPQLAGKIPLIYCLLGGYMLSTTYTRNNHPWDWYIYRHLVDVYGECLFLFFLYNMLDPIRLGDSKSSRKTKLLIHPSNENTWLFRVYMGLYYPLVWVF